MISRRKEIIKEILLTLAYPALLSLGVLCLLPFTSEPGSLPDVLAWFLLIFGTLLLLGTFVLAVFDWDMYHDFHPVINFLLIFVRIGAILLLFFPFQLFWTLIFGIITVLF